MSIFILSYLQTAAYLKCWIHDAFHGNRLIWRRRKRVCCRVCCRVSGKVWKVQHSTRADTKVRFKVEVSFFGSVRSPSGLPHQPILTPPKLKMTPKFSRYYTIAWYLELEKCSFYFQCRGLNEYTSPTIHSSSSKLH